VHKTLNFLPARYVSINEIALGVAIIVTIKLTVIYSIFAYV
jgi:hypothetical protein